MDLMNIYPIKNQVLYKYESAVMILAHLVEKDLYDPKNFRNTQWITMDNGLFEGQQVSTDLMRCIKIALSSEIPVKEIVIPDVANDLEKTIELFNANFETIKEWHKRFTFMFVAQATTFDELKKGFDFISQFVSQGLNLSVAVSKLSPLDRSAPEAIQIYKKSPYPIHFLGLKKAFGELIGAAPYIRTCDTSQLAYIAKNEQDIPREIYRYTRDNDESKAIDLENDECNFKMLTELRQRFMSVEVPGVIL